jgi:hypothetical protein
VRTWPCATAALLLAMLSAAAVADFPLPGWSRVDLESRRLLLSARSSLRLSLPDTGELAAALDPGLLQSLPVDAGSPVLRVDVISRALGGESRVSSWLDRETMQVLQKEHLDSVRNGRFKRLLFSANGVQEVQRRGDAQTRDLGPQQWRLKRERFTPLQAIPPYVDQIAVLLLAGNMVLRGESQHLQRVYADGRLVDVLLTRGASETLSLRHTRAESGGETRHGTAAAVAVHIAVDAVHDPAADFELLGLRSPLLLQVDAQTGAPLRLSGYNARLGQVTIAATRVDIAVRKTGP